MPPRISGISCHGILPLPPSCRSSVRLSMVSSQSFSATCYDQTRQRRLMNFWLDGVGQTFKDPLPGSSNYLSAYSKSGILRRTAGSNPTDGADSKPTAYQDNLEIPRERFTDLHPFPLNTKFRSQPVTNEELREDVWKSIMIDGQSVKTVSANLGVEMNRVGAIVRLKEVEKEWLRKGKRLALPYAKAVMAMLPQTYENEPFEPINDLPVHAATKQQIFHPTSESRHFTRADAARVFDESLLPADKRVPHPELADLEKESLETGKARHVLMRTYAGRAEVAEQKHNAAEKLRKELDAKSLTVVDGKRWQFRFREVQVDAAGPDGRGRHGVGWRYGVPHMDRRRGEVKIPVRVA